MTTPPSFDRLFVPIASEGDARATARAVTTYLGERDGSVVVGHVVEKAGGAPDKASVEQRENRAERLFADFRDELAATAVDDEYHVLYGTNVADRILAAADEFDADAIAFTPRGGSRLFKLLSGDVALRLVSDADRPVIVLPDPDGGGESDG